MIIFQSGNSLFFVDMPAEGGSTEEGGVPGACAAEPTTLRTDLDKDDVLRDSGCFPDSRTDYTPASFNNLSYEDFELKSR